MTVSQPNTVDLTAARTAFENAAQTHEQVHERFFMARLLGLSFSYSDETCAVTFEAESFMFNPKGSLHGGVMCLVMDVTMGHLLNHLEQPAVTLEIKTQFMRAIRGGTVRAVGSVLQRGRSVCYTQCQLFDQEGKLAAFATATWKPCPSGRVA